MSTEIISIQNVHGYVDGNGTAWLNVEDVVRGLGFIKTEEKVSPTSGRKVYESIRWERINGYLAEYSYPPVKSGDFVPENIFYLLAMKANNETAKKFQFKIANEILPQIRKTGSYGRPLTYLEAMKELVRKEEERLALEAKNKELQVTQDLYDTVTLKNKWYSAKTVTDVLNILGLGRTNFYRFLRDQGIVTNKNQPMRKHIESGLMRARFDEWLEQYIVSFSLKGLKYIFVKLIKAKKLPENITEEIWIEYCNEIEFSEEK